MYTQLLVIQKINEDASLHLYTTSYGKPVQWSFDDTQKKKPADRDIFPFEILDKSRIGPMRNGPDARCSRNENQLIYSEDFGVPGGTVVAILFPKNYIPDIIKFNDKPKMPVGTAGLLTSTSPGQFEIKYNYEQKQCAIIFHIFNGTLYGLKCIAKQVTDAEFPDSTTYVRDEVLDVTLSRQFLNVDAITTEDLMLINTVMDQANMADVEIILNEILDALKEANQANSRTLLAKLGTYFTNATGLLSGLVTIADSYKDGNAAQQFVGRIIEYYNL